MLEELIARYTYLDTAILLGIGFWGMLGKRNLMKKLIGLNIFQTAIFLFFIEGASKEGGSVPIIDAGLGTAAAQYVNPLPHVLILTAIVVSVATTGVALAILLSIHRQYGSLDERAIQARMAEGEAGRRA